MRIGTLPWPNWMSTFKIRGYILPSNIGDKCLSISRYRWQDDFRTFKPEAPVFTLKCADKTGNHTIMLQRNQYSSNFLYLALLFPLMSIVKTFTFCSRDTFGSPRYSDCSSALLALPTSKDAQFFVEQQLRTQFPRGDWPLFTDPRPPGLRKEIVQIPRFWNIGGSTLCAVISTLSNCQDPEC